jgi:hypothetical protein
MSITTSLAEGSTEYILSEAIIRSDRLGESIDISSVISQFTIYEHIEKPYLTMSMSFVDQSNIIQLIDMQGGEKLSIALKQTEEIENGKEIKKDFLIEKIQKSIKVEERNELVIIHCVEYHMFESSAQNVNKSFSGAPSNIIKTLITNYLSKSIVIDGNDSIENMKVIIPNLHPVEAASWLKNKVTTPTGMPFFLFSALGVENLVLRDFQKMLEQTVSNINHPYIYASSMSNNSGINKYYNILEYKYESADDLMKLLRRGLVGASYNFYDVHRGVQNIKHFNVDNVFQGLLAQNLLGGNNSRYSYGPDYKIKDKKLANYDSKVITKISSIGAYRGNQYTADFRSLSDETLGGDPIKHINSKAIKGFLAKQPLSITVKGREFFTGDNNYTLGKTIRVIFLDTDTSDTSSGPSKDLKKSGDYIIIGAKHSFANEMRTSELICGKIASLGKEIAV